MYSCVRRYDAKSINSIVLAFGRLLLGATSTAVLHPGGPPGSHPPPVGFTNLTGCMVTSLQSDGDPSGARGHFLIGQFLLEDGRTAVLVHNQDPYVTQWATITFEAKLNKPTEAAGVLEVDPVHVRFTMVLAAFGGVRVPAMAVRTGHGGGAAGRQPAARGGADGAATGHGEVPGRPACGDRSRPYGMNEQPFWGGNAMCYR